MLPFTSLRDSLAHSRYSVQQSVSQSFLYSFSRSLGRSLACSLTVFPVHSSHHSVNHSHSSSFLTLYITLPSFFFLSLIRLIQVDIFTHLLCLSFPHGLVYLLQKASRFIHSRRMGVLPTSTSAKGVIRKQDRNSN